VAWTMTQSADSSLPSVKLNQMDLPSAVAAVAALLLLADRVCAALRCPVENMSFVTGKEANASAGVERHQMEDVIPAVHVVVAAKDVGQMRDVLVTDVSASVEGDKVDANIVQDVLVAIRSKLSVLKVDYLKETSNVYVTTDERNHLVVLRIIAELTVESAEPATSMESVSARENTLLVIEDVKLFKENQSVSNRFVAYQVSVCITRFVMKAYVFLILVVLNLTGTQYVGTKMPDAWRGMVDEIVVASVVEGNLPAIDVLLWSAPKKDVLKANVAFHQRAKSSAHVATANHRSVLMRSIV